MGTGQLSTWPVFLEMASSCEKDAVSFLVPALPPPSPNLFGIRLPLVFGRLVDDESARIVSAPLVLDRSGNVLRQCLSTRIVLARPPSLSGPCHREREPGVVRLTKPAKIRRRIVVLVTVLVVDDQEAG